jgi:hypothetical protein
LHPLPTALVHVLERTWTWANVMPIAHRLLLPSGTLRLEVSDDISQTSPAGLAGGRAFRPAFRAVKFISRAERACTAGAMLAAGRNFPIRHAAAPYSNAEHTRPAGIGLQRHVPLSTAEAGKSPASACRSSSATGGSHHSAADAGHAELPGTTRAFRSTRSARTRQSLRWNFREPYSKKRVAIAGLSSGSLPKIGGEWGHRFGNALAWPALGNRLNLDGWTLLQGSQKRSIRPELGDESS